MSYTHLTITRKGHVAVVALNRPDKHNALCEELMLDLVRVTEEFHGDVETRAVVFTGMGKHFSAGADLAESRTRMAKKPGLLQAKRYARIGPQVIRCLHEMEQITIAAFNGGALGGGACIVSALDFRIAAEDAFVAYPEIHLGMNLSWGALPLCVHLVGPARAKRMVILGDREKATTLKEWGFVDEVVPPDQLLAKAVELAETYALRPPIQAQMIKRSVNRIAGALDSALTHMDTDQFLLCATTRDHEEGIRAFLEKRAPNYRGA